ncbi:MAG: phospholipase D-like domain-containing protein [Candidatus Woesearchaeota archaeon]
MRWDCIFFLFVAMILFFWGFSSVDEKVVFSQESLSVLMCPDCKDELFFMVEQANSSILCAFYEFSYQPLIDLFDAKSADGVIVKVIIDRAYVFDRPYLRPDTRSAYMHHKFCIIDQKRGFSGSANPTHTSFHISANNIVFFESESLSRIYMDAFLNLYAGNFTNIAPTQITQTEVAMTPVEVYFCPQDSCARQIIGHLRQATESIYFLTFAFTHNEIGNELIIQSYNGVRVQGIMDTRLVSQYSQFDPFLLQNISVIRKSIPRGSMHHKVFVIDEKTIIAGSMNPSQNADTRNNENILIIKNKTLAQAFVQEYYRLI